MWEENVWGGGGVWWMSVLGSKFILVVGECDELVEKGREWVWENGE